MIMYCPAFSVLQATKNWEGGVKAMITSDCFYPARACAKGLSNWFCPSVCQFVSQSSKKLLNLNIDRVKQFPVALCVPHRKENGFIPSAFPAVSYLTSCIICHFNMVNTVQSGYLRT